MGRTRQIALILLALLAHARRGDAQSAGVERWQIQLDGGEYLWDLRLGPLQGDSLTVRQADSTFTVPVGAVRELRLLQKTTFRLGDGGDGAAPMRALTGGDDEVYDLAALDFADRLRVVREVLSRHPPAF